MLLALRRLSYSKEIREVARFLRLNDVFRNLYYWALRPAGGVLRCEIAGVTAQFRVETPLELRCLDPAGDMGGEKGNLEWFLFILRPGDVVYDIGANFGLFTIFLARAVGNHGQVVSFEPDERSYEHLQDNIRLNGLANVRCIRKGLGEQNTPARLYYHKEGPGTSTLIAPGRDKHADCGYQTIELVEGDSLVQAENLPLPRVVKIDVEGFEMAVMKGLRHTLGHPAVEMVFCEVHPHLLPDGIRAEDVFEFLKSLGFGRVERLHRAGHDARHLIAFKSPLLEEKEGPLAG